MLKTPTRKREFSEFRPSPLSRSIRCDTSPAQQLTPTASRRGILNNTIGAQSRLITAHHHQRDKSKEICVNCVNKRLVRQHNEKKQKQRKEEQAAAERYRRQAEQQKREQARKEAQQRAKELEFFANAERQNKKREEKLKKQQLARKEQEWFRETQQRQEMQKSRRIQREKEKRQAFKRDLQRQVQQEMQKRKRQKQAEMMPTFVNNDFSEDRRKVAQQKLNNDYRRALQQQIAQNNERAKKQQQKQLQFDQQLREQQKMRKTFEPNVRVIDPTNDYLREQIEDRRRKKQRQLQETRIKTEEDARKAIQQQNLKAKRQAAANHAKIDRYMKQLADQIHENRVKKMKQQEYDKQPAFTTAIEEKKPKLQDCADCHQLYPKSYLSVFNQ